MRTRWRTGIDVGSSLIQIHPIPAEEFAEFTSVDNRERVEPVNAGDSSLIFEIGESAGRDEVLFILCLPARRSLAVSTSRNVNPSLSRTLRRFTPTEIILPRFCFTSSPLR